MAGYTKLFSSIVASTIWRAKDHTRLVWITMLAMSDSRGVVEASVPGLADMARVSVAECRLAIADLEAPDEDSRTKDCDGRRILPVDGGWKLINHAKYRDKVSAEDRREYQAEWVKEKRRQRVDKGRQKSTLSIHTTPTPTPDTKDQDQTLTRKTRASWFDGFWAMYPKRMARANAEKAWKKLNPDEALAALIYAGLDRSKASPAWKERMAEQGMPYIPYASTWLNGRRWEDEVVTANQVKPAVGSPDYYDAEDWFEECKRLHDRKCNGRVGHHNQMAIDADRAAKKAGK